MSHLTLDEKIMKLKEWGIIPIKVKSRLYYFNTIPQLTKNNYYFVIYAIDLRTEKIDATVKIKASEALINSPQEVIESARVKLIKKLKDKKFKGVK